MKKALGIIALDDFKIIKGDYPQRFLHELISSQLDMDRLDYLRRDSFFTGVTEGNIGSARIIKMLDIVDDKLVVNSKGIYSIENYLTTRRLMYWQVYLHKLVQVHLPIHQAPCGKIILDGVYSLGVHHQLIVDNVKHFDNSCRTDIALGDTRKKGIATEIIQPVHVELG